VLVTVDCFFTIFDFFSGGGVVGGSLIIAQLVFGTLFLPFIKLLDRVLEFLLLTRGDFDLFEEDSLVALGRRDVMPSLGFDSALIASIVEFSSSLRLEMISFCFLNGETSIGLKRVVPFGTGLSMSCPASSLILACV